MLESTKHFIEEHIKDIENNEWDRLHNILYSRGDLNTHIDFVKSLLDSNIKFDYNGVSKYNSTKLLQDLETIRDISVQDFYFDDSNRIDYDLLMYLKNKDIAQALTNILRLTEYIGENDFITGNGESGNNVVIALEGIYDSRNIDYNYQTIIIPYASVNLPIKRIATIESAFEMPGFNVNIDMEDNEIFAITQDDVFESNINTMLNVWSHEHFDIEPDPS